MKHMPKREVSEVREASEASEARVSFIAVGNAMNVQRGWIAILPTSAASNMIVFTQQDGQDVRLATNVDKPGYQGQFK